MNTRLELQDILSEWEKLLPYLQQNTQGIPLELLSPPPFKRRKLERRYKEIRDMIASNSALDQGLSLVSQHLVRMIKEALSALDRRRALRRTIMTLVAAGAGLLVGLISLIRHWN